MKLSLILSTALLISLALFAQDAPWRMQLAHYASCKVWQEQQENLPEITPETLDEAIEAAGMYIMNQQLPDGNFKYAYDFISGMEDTKDNQVRQAGVLWSICNLNRDRFTEATRRSALLGLDFFMRNQRGLPDEGTRIVVTTYKGEPVIRTGTVALFCLAIIDFVEGQERYLSEAQKKPFLTALENNLRFLQFQELSSGSWREEYELGAVRLPDDIAPVSPYFDGESLLAYVKAASFYRARPELTPPFPIEERILTAMPLLLKKYTVECFVPEGDDNLTKGFFQWGAMACMAASELFHDDDFQILCRDGALSLAWWLIYGHSFETRNGNTGYAIEGLVSSYYLARKHGLQEEMKILRKAIEDTLARLMTWQVGGPFESYSPLLTAWKGKIPPRCFGGITSTADSGYIRIDVVQHQLHAMMLARKHIFNE